MLNTYKRQIEFQKEMNSDLDTMYLALVEEMGEFVASLGYADWKKTERDNENLIIETADIIIFAMNCSYYSGCKESSYCLQVIHGLDTYAAEDTEDIDVIKRLIGFLYIDNFRDLAAYMAIRYPEAKKLVIGKQALNKLRQDYGYKEDKYNKYWNGVEDNSYLFNVLKREQDYDSIYEALRILYNVYN